MFPSMSEKTVENVTDATAYYLLTRRKNIKKVSYGLQRKFLSM